jgi:RNA polymerase sigma factor (sigma-70 family)
VEKNDWLAEEFEKNRIHLRAVAFRMLGSVSEADDAVQETWLRLSKSDSDEIQNLQAWLTTVIARICLDILRSRKLRKEISFHAHLPDPLVSFQDRIDPEQNALLADSIGLALFVVLGTLTPAERVAFVLHDMFGIPFDDISAIVGSSVTAARQLASRARKRVRNTPSSSDTDLKRQREVVDAFVAAAREGDFEALLAVLDPDIVLRADRGAVPPEASVVIRGARVVAQRAMMFAKVATYARPALINGAAGIVSFDKHQHAFAVMGFTIARGKIIEIDILADPARLRKLSFSLAP